MRLFGLLSSLLSLWVPYYAIDSIIAEEAVGVPGVNFLSCPSLVIPLSLVEVMRGSVILLDMTSCQRLRA